MLPDLLEDMTPQEKRFCFSFLFLRCLEYALLGSPLEELLGCKSLPFFAGQSGHRHLGQSEPGDIHEDDYLG